MNFAHVITAVCGQLDTAGVRYALIGGFAMALRGVPRAVGDWNDIRLLLEAARERALPLDWALLEDYLRLFNLAAKLPELKSIHGTAQ